MATKIVVHLSDSRPRQIVHPVGNELVVDESPNICPAQHVYSTYGTLWAGVFFCLKRERLIKSF
jgi:hypothetical protein